MVEFQRVDSEKSDGAWEPTRLAPLRSLFGDMGLVLYALALIVSIALWILAIRSPLWLDENISFWQISEGFSHILSRQGGLSFPLYSYILWFATKILGTSEIALRIPSVIAMLGALYLVYLAGRGVLGREAGLVAAIVFSLHPLVAFAATDARPYAFAALATAAAIYCLLRLLQTDSNALAVLFGLLAALIVYFHLLFIVIVPSLAIGLLLFNHADWKTRWRQFGVALAAFAVGFLPVIPGILYMFRTSGTHVFENVPEVLDLLFTIAPLFLLFIYAGCLIVSAIKQPTRKKKENRKAADQRFWLCALIGLVPLLILFSVSAWTSVHIFTPRYRLVALPGIALCWAFAVNILESRTVRLLFCLLLVVATALQDYRSPLQERYGYTWKYALDVAETNASRDNAPVLICSDLPEADHMPIPQGEAVKDSTLFAPLSYYKLTVPVVGLPRSLNDQAIRISREFLKRNGNHRFLAMGYEPSFDTLDWLTQEASSDYDSRQLGVFDGVSVFEFIPKTPAEH